MYCKETMGKRPATFDESEYPRLTIPNWVENFVRTDVPTTCTNNDGVVIRTKRDRSYTLVTAECPGADRLNPVDFEDHVERMYLLIRSALEQSPARYPVRMWNFIPDIHRPIGDELDRYMLFNIGRFRAFSKWYGQSQFGRVIATASGVGHRDEGLFIHCLASRQPGAAVENPRQVPAYYYSSRYGPKPPSFARGTISRATVHYRDRGGSSNVLFVGGTASIRGERSLHESDIKQQTDETLENLGSLVNAACVQTHATNKAESEEKHDDLFERFHHLRVYLVRPADYDIVAPHIISSFPNAIVEWRRADLCRSELLIEMEGVANVSERIAAQDFQWHPQSNGHGLTQIETTVQSNGSGARCPKTDLTPS